jgi:hypothetical protein
LLARSTSAERIANIHANPLCDANTNAHAYAHCNCATYSNTQRQSYTKDSPDSSSSSVIGDKRGVLDRVLLAKRKSSTKTL